MNLSISTNQLVEVGNHLGVPFGEGRHLQKGNKICSVHFTRCSSSHFDYPDSQCGPIQTPLDADETAKVAQYKHLLSQGRRAHLDSVEQVSEVRERSHARDEVGVGHIAQAVLEARVSFEAAVLSSW